MFFKNFEIEVRIRFFHFDAKSVIFSFFVLKFKRIKEKIYRSVCSSIGQYCMEHQFFSFKFHLDDISSCFKTFTLFKLLFTTNYGIGIFGYSGNLWNVTLLSLLSSICPELVVKLRCFLRLSVCIRIQKAISISIQSMNTHTR